MDIVKLKLPFEMGTEIIDHNYMVFDISHPVLEIGSSASSLKYEVWEWLNASFGDDWEFKFDGDDYCLFFKNQSQ